MASWNWQFARRQFGRMTLRSAFRYRDFLIRARAGRTRPGGLVALDMTRPIRGPLWFREEGSDLVTFEEVVEAEVYRPVVEVVGECRQVVDLGANIGLASRYFLAAYPAARVLAVEPNAETFALLERNLAAVPGGRGRAVRAAVWGRSTPLRVGEVGGDRRYDCVSVSEAVAGGGDTVPGVTVDELCDRHGLARIDLLKVDIEGAERQLFTGNTSWLDRVGTIAIEFHGASRAESGFDAVVGRHGFAVNDTFPHTVLATRAPVRGVG